LQPRWPHPTALYFDLDQCALGSVGTMLGAGVEIGVACGCGAIVFAGQLSATFVHEVLLSTRS
jgi:hypothetical protein